MNHISKTREGWVPSSWFILKRLCLVQRASALNLGGLNLPSQALLKAPCLSLNHLRKIWWVRVLSFLTLLEAPSLSHRPSPCTLRIGFRDSSPWQSSWLSAWSISGKSGGRIQSPWSLLKAHCFIHGPFPQKCVGYGISHCWPFPKPLGLIFGPSLQKPAESSLVFLLLAKAMLP